MKKSLPYVSYQAKMSVRLITSFAFDFPYIWYSIGFLEVKNQKLMGLCCNLSKCLYENGNISIFNYCPSGYKLIYISSYIQFCEFSLDKWIHFNISYFRYRYSSIIYSEFNYEQYYKIYHNNLNIGVLLHDA